MLKNIFKLSFTNFKEIWKILVYRVIYFMFVLGLTTVASWNIIETLIKENFFVNLQENFKSLAFSLDFSKVFVAINATFKDFANIVSANGLVVQTIVCVVLVVLLCSFFEVHGKAALHTNINGYMNSMVQYGFANSYVSSFGRSCLHWLVYIITELPITLAMYVGAYLFASTLSTSIGAWSVLLGIALLVVGLSIKNVIFGGWLPAIVVNQKRIVKSMADGIKALCKSFVKVLFCYVLFVSLGITLTMFSLTFTVGIGLLLVLPLWTVEEAIVAQVSYYEAYGMRYYVDSNEVITPKRLEQQDKFANVKDII